MTLQLHCKRSKIFHHSDGEREISVSAARGEVTPVPDWVKDTLGYRMGLKDKSIVDLTPPKHVEATEEAPAHTEASVEDVGSDDPDGSGEQAPEDAKPKAQRSNVPKGLQGASTVVKTK